MLKKRLHSLIFHIKTLLFHSGLLSKAFIGLLVIIITLSGLIIKDLSTKSEISSVQNSKSQTNFSIDQVTIVPTNVQKANSATPVPTVLPTSAATHTSSSIPTPTASSQPTPTPLPTATPTPGIADTEPPHTNIYFPQENGTITSSYQPSSGNYPCIALNPPMDNISHSSEIMTEYAVDGGPWSGYASADSRAYICMVILNGSHTIQIRSKDKAGNVESPQTLHFTVDMP